MTSRYTPQATAPCNNLINIKKLLGKGFCNTARSGRRLRGHVVWQNCLWNRLVCQEVRGHEVFDNCFILNEKNCNFFFQELYFGFPSGSRNNNICYRNLELFFLLLTHPKILGFNHWTIFFTSITTLRQKYVKGSKFQVVYIIFMDFWWAEMEAK